MRANSPEQRCPALRLVLYRNTKKPMPKIELFLRMQRIVFSTVRDFYLKK